MTRRQLFTTLASAATALVASPKKALANFGKVSSRVVSINDIHTLPLTLNTGDRLVLCAKPGLQHLDWSVSFITDHNNTTYDAKVQAPISAINVMYVAPKPMKIIALMIRSSVPSAYLGKLIYIK